MFGDIPRELLHIWGCCRQAIANVANPIAICEAAAVLFCLWQYRAHFAGQGVI